MAQTRVVVVGGSDAGVMAALWAKATDSSLHVEMVVKDQWVNYSVCGAPMFLGGEVPSVEKLAHRSLSDIEALGIHVHLNTEALAVDGNSQVLHVVHQGVERSVPFDRLVIAQGAQAAVPPLPGRDLPGVFSLHDMEDTVRIDRFIAQYQPQRAVIVGAGYIGLEMADALTHRHMTVTVVERLPQVLPTVDREFAHRLAGHLGAHGVHVMTDTTIERIERAGQGLVLTCHTGERLDADMVMIVVGVRPHASLAQSAGLHVHQGAVVVDERMATNRAHIWAAGDGVITQHQLLGTTYLPLGTTAHKQGRIAGINAAGGQAVFRGVVGTQVVKIFDWVVGRTGLKEEEARKVGFTPLTVESELTDHKVYYPGASPLWIRLTGDQHTRRLLGAQIMGQYGAEVAKRIDLFAIGLMQGALVDDVNDWDLSYTPPVSSPFDPVQMAAQAWQAAWKTQQ